MNVMRTFDKKHTKEVIFPLGGIGTGCIGLAGNGRLCDWEIFNRPDKGGVNGHTHFAVRTMDAEGNATAKALCGDTLKDLMGQYSKAKWTGYGYGIDKQTMAGFPHFPEWRFESEFPFAHVHFSAPDFPAEVILHAFSPFIPLDEDASGIPAAFFEVEFRNADDRDRHFSVAFSVNRPFRGVNRLTDIEGAPAVFMQSDAQGETPEYRDMTLACLHRADRVQAQAYWYRGGWQDSIATFWREFSSGKPLTARAYDEVKSSDTCTLCAEVDAARGESVRVRFLLSWNAPVRVRDWELTEELKNCGKPLTWRNYYATLWENSHASAAHAIRNWASLQARSQAFSDALSSSTLDPVAMETATANLCTLRTPTVMRLEDGSLWGWEGVHEKEGSCPGTCTHVWNYAYALPFLFPRLERSLRENDYRYNMFENGRMAFRMPLPPGITMGWANPCLDGQMGGIIKTYRDFKLCGDVAWLRGLWPRVKKALEYAWIDDGISAWDADCDGVLEGRQHHTLDMELFGPSGWLQGFYLAALKAAAEMAEVLGERADAQIYRELFAKGSVWTEENLFNGSYYIHKVDLTDRSQLDRFGVTERYWNEETGEIKYQIAEGCEIDQLCAQWHADIVGLGDVFDPIHRKVALRSLYQNNFKPTMRNFANPWRVFVSGDEAGTVMCDYPQGVYKPTIPIPYCEECMSGFEYALATLMLAEGLDEEGMTLLRALHARCDGENRNPFGEIECGNNYARAMASWAVIPILSGYEFDLARGHIGFRPRVEGDMTAFWSCADAWGTLKAEGNGMTLRVIEGELALSSFGCERADMVLRVRADGRDVEFITASGGIAFPSRVAVSGELHIVVA